MAVLWMTGPDVVRTRPPDWLRCACIVLAYATLCSPAASQTIHGRLLEEQRDVPIEGAVVSLIDVDGEVRASSISDSLGRFTLSPPEAGEYHVRAIRLGYELSRTPLLALSAEGTADLDLLMRPEPVGLEGLEVSVERLAERYLGPLGHTPESLGQRWIDREDIDKMTLPGLPEDVIRWQGIAGVWVFDFDPGQLGARLCVQFTRRRIGDSCALTVLNGAVINSQAAYHLDPYSLEAIAILEPIDAVTLYGTAAHGGAVLMWTREGR